MKQLFTFISLLLLISCAQIVTPDGGDKDIIAPKIVSSNPQSGSLNTAPKKVVITFNENIELKNKNENISINPSLNYKPEISSHKNKIEITFNTDSFVPNITYSVNFGKSIVDINEGNCFENYFYCFSTGNKLDTAIAYGNVKLIKENSPAKKATVSLNHQANKINYKTFTDENGNWTINNLPTGNYWCNIYLDNNSNNTLDPSEYYFKRSVKINDTVNSFSAKVIHYVNWDENQKLKVKEVTFINSYALALKTNKPLKTLDQLKFNITNDNNKKQPSLVKTNKTDSFLIYHPFIPNDSLNIVIVGDTIQTFIVIQTKKRSIDTLKINPSLKLIGLYDPIKLHSNIPIKLINSEQISINGSFTGFEINPVDPYTLLVNSKTFNTKKIILLKGALTDFNGLENNTDSIIVTIATPEETGSYEFTIKDSSITYKGAVIAHVFNENNSYIINTELGKLNKLTGLLPGNYSIEIWLDDNNNNKWDEGNYTENIPPEKIKLLKNFFVIKPNWDNLGVDIPMD